MIFTFHEMTRSSPATQRNLYPASGKKNLKNIATRLQDCALFIVFGASTEVYQALCTG
jgi:hypothetical protein